MIESKILNDENNRSLEEQKKKSLHAIDNAKFSCFHVRAIAVSGIGFFTVGGIRPDGLLLWTHVLDRLSFLRTRMICSSCNSF
jgi:hypothetical protein